MMNRVLIFCIAFLGFTFTVNSQVKEVSSNRLEFIENLSKHMSYHKKKEGKKFIEEEFALVYTEANFNAEMHAKVVQVTNLLLKNKVKVSPDFENWLNCLISFPESTHDEAFFNSWIDFINKLQEKKKTKKYIPKFIQQCLFLIQSGEFYSRPSIKWKVAKSNFKLEFDSIPSLGRDFMEIKEE